MKFKYPYLLYFLLFTLYFFTFLGYDPLQGTHKPIDGPGGDGVLDLQDRCLMAS